MRARAPRAVAITAALLALAAALAAAVAIASAIPPASAAPGAAALASPKAPPPPDAPSAKAPSAPEAPPAGAPEPEARRRRSGGFQGRVTIEVDPEVEGEDVDPDATSADGRVLGVVNVNVSRDVRIEEGQVHNDDLVVIGGDAVILGEVRGDVVVLSGSLTLDGRVKGDVVAVMSDTAVGDNARIGGDLVHLGGQFEASPEAKIGGETFHADLPGLASGAFGEGAREVAYSFLGVAYLTKVLFFAILFWAMLILVCVAPRRITTAGEALGQAWGRALITGLLAYAAYVVLACIFLILCLVLIGIPLLALLAFAWFVTKALGLASLLWLLGDRVSRNVLHRDTSPLVAFLMGFLIYLPTQIVPFHWGLVWLVLSVLGNLLGTCLTALAVGLALATQFGTTDGLGPWRLGRYPQAAPAASAPAYPPAPPAPPGSFPP